MGLGKRFITDQALSPPTRPVSRDSFEAQRSQRSFTDNKIVCFLQSGDIDWRKRLSPLRGYGTIEHRRPVRFLSLLSPPQKYIRPGRDKDLSLTAPPRQTKETMSFSLYALCDSVVKNLFRTGSTVNPTDKSDRPENKSQDKHRQYKRMLHNRFRLKFQENP